MNTHDMLPQKVGIKVTELQDSYGTIDIVYCNIETGEPYKMSSNVFYPYGEVNICRLHPYEPDYDWEEIWPDPEKYDEKYIRNLDCGGAYCVVNAFAAGGWGPLLYDIAIELATIKGSGLVSDRTSVSLAAQDVWEKYMNIRGDVEKFQCDDQYNTLTDDPGDNVDMEIIGARDYFYDPKNIRSNPLAKRLSKPPTTIQALESSGKLIMTKRKPMRKTL